MTLGMVGRARVPLDTLPLIAAVAIGGDLAGFLAEMPLLFFTTALVAIGLAVAAVLSNRVHEWSELAEDTLGQLPAGRARAMLGDLLRRAAAVPAVAQAGPLVAAACEAARQLSALELHGAAFDAQRDAVPNPSARWRDAEHRCERGRELLTQRLQDASAALSRWQAAQGAGENLGALARELNEESRYQQEAAQDVEALLA